MCIYLLTVLGLCCCPGFSLAGMSEGHSLVGMSEGHSLVGMRELSEVVVPRLGARAR